ncbi:Lrp/AsnC family transcriptional regulator [Dehalococcoidia bacterium]|nr:Lrp/AsnC family transcriptional regulator [Dehalococcoidia bacterium]
MMREILKLLEKDSRTSPEQIATMLDRPVAEVEQTIREAEAERVIVRYKTIINWDKLEEEVVWAFIEVKVQPQRDRGFDEVAERIYRFPEAYSVYLVSGDYDLAVLVRGKSLREVAGFVAQKLAPMESVQGTVTHFLLKRYKEDGEILEREEKPKRLPLSI